MVSFIRNVHIKEMISKHQSLIILRHVKGYGVGSIEDHWTRLLDCRDVVAEVVELVMQLL